MSVAASDRIVITGGAGFLGGSLVGQLRQRGYQNLIIPRRKEYDLTNEGRILAIDPETSPGTARR